MADKFIVKAHGVITERDSARSENFFLKIFSEFGLSDTVMLSGLRSNFGDHNCARARQSVVGHFDKNINWFTNRLKIKRGALTSKLHNAIFSWAQARSFEIVEEKSLFHTHIIAQEKTPHRSAGLP